MPDAPAIMVVTHRGLQGEHAPNAHKAPGDFSAFLGQLQHIVQAGPDAIILREKDLCEAAYQPLLQASAAICEQHAVHLIAHTHIAAAQQVRAQGLHLSFSQFAACMKPAAGGAHAQRSPHHLLREFAQVGVSVHTVQEAEMAVQWGAAYLVFGHVFATASKPGLPPRGLEALGTICRRAAPAPVYAIGGISPRNAADTAQHGAAGICIMSSIMQSPDPAATLAQYRHALRGHGRG